MPISVDVSTGLQESISLNGTSGQDPTRVRKVLGCHSRYA